MKDICQVELKIYLALDTIFKFLEGQLSATDNHSPETDNYPS